MKKSLTAYGTVRGKRKLNNVSGVEVTKSLSDANNLSKEMDDLADVGLSEEELETRRRQKRQRQVEAVLDSSQDKLRKEKVRIDKQLNKMIDASKVQRQKLESREHQFHVDMAYAKSSKEAASIQKSYQEDVATIMYGQHGPGSEISAMMNDDIRNQTADMEQSTVFVNGTPVVVDKDIAEEFRKQTNPFVGVGKGVTFGSLKKAVSVDSLSKDLKLSSSENREMKKMVRSYYNDFRASFREMNRNLNLDKMDMQDIERDAYSEQFLQSKYYYDDGFKRSLEDDRPVREIPEAAYGIVPDDVLYVKTPSGRYLAVPEAEAAWYENMLYQQAHQQEQQMDFY